MTRIVEVDGTDHYFAENGLRVADELKRFLSRLGGARAPTACSPPCSSPTSSSPPHAARSSGTAAGLLDEHDAIVHERSPASGGAS